MGITALAAATTSAVGAAMPSRPNILLLLSDQHRHDWTSLNPELAGKIETPNLEWLAQHGVRFTNALCASPICGPSRACLASGVQYNACGMKIHERNWPVDRLDSHYRHMRDEGGYHVAGCGKFDLRKATNDAGVQGIAHTAEWGFADAVNTGGKWDAYNLHSKGQPASDPYYLALEKSSFTRGYGDLKKLHIDDYAARHGGERSYTHTAPTGLPDELYIDNWVADTGVSLLDRAPRGKPWYVVVNFSGPHEPLDITETMSRRAASRPPLPQPYGYTGSIPAASHEAIRRNYAAMIENIDSRIGTFIDLLRRRGELENTLIIYASDHGEMLGDRNRWAKSVPFHQSVGIPLIVAGPGVKSGITNASPVSLIDIGATALDYAGVRSHLPSALSLRPILEKGVPKIRDHVVSGLAGWRLIDDGRYKLVCGHDIHSTTGHGSNVSAPALLFDRSADPNETRDISATNPEQVAKMSALLDRELPAAPVVPA